jgi:hypothetical protein
MGMMLVDRPTLSDLSRHAHRSDGSAQIFSYSPADRQHEKHTLFNDPSLGSSAVSPQRRSTNGRSRSMAARDAVRGLSVLQHTLGCVRCQMLIRHPKTMAPKRHSAGWQGQLALNRVDKHTNAE